MYYHNPRKSSYPYHNELTYIVQYCIYKWCIHISDLLSQCQLVFHVTQSCQVQSLPGMLPCFLATSEGKCDDVLKDTLYYYCAVWKWDYSGRTDLEASILWYCLVDPVLQEPAGSSNIWGFSVFIIFYLFELISSGLSVGKGDRWIHRWWQDSVSYVLFTDFSGSTESLKVSRK